MLKDSEIRGFERGFAIGFERGFKRQRKMAEKIEKAIQELLDTQQISEEAAAILRAAIQPSES